MNETHALYGWLAEFEHAEDLVTAVEAARKQGYRRMEALSPFPVEGLDEALHLRPTRLPWLTLLGALLGAVGGYAMQAYAMQTDLPVNVGGRPLNSWPAWLPITFELGVLSAALFTVLGMLALNGLPRPHHPLFAVPQFKLASRDRFFLCIERLDPSFSVETTREFLQSLRPSGVWPVPQ
ncbi:MAG TPA: DUF3341 domain-containing protein [Planctomycetaceae bacterium]|nr:DUF3341 domain-containing protein [Planctomycetaceae bacterium]